MLAKYPVDVMLLATDLEVARRFYGDTLGLPLLLEDEQFLTFGCGGDSRLVVTKSSTGTAEEATKVCWRVDDLAAEVAELRGAGRPGPGAAGAGHRERRRRNRLRAGGLVRRPSPQLHRLAPAQVAATGDRPGHPG